MAQQIEIELKNILTKAEYNNLLNALPFPKQPIWQTNHYFDTKGMALKEKHCSLRIRHKQGQYTLTLKEPLPVGLLETNDQLTKLQYTQWIEQHPTETIHVSNRLKKLNIA